VTIPADSFDAVERPAQPWLMPSYSGHTMPSGGNPGVKGDGMTTHASGGFSIGAATPYDPLHPAEAQLLHHVEDSARRYMHSVIVDASGHFDTAVRASFLTWLLIGLAGRMPPVVELNLTGASVEGIFDLSGLTISAAPQFFNCRFGDGILLKDAEVPAFQIHGGHVQGIDADRVSVKGSLALTSVEVRRQLRLCGAKIGGNLNLRLSRILGEDAQDPHLIALFADGLQVAGSVLMSNRFGAVGEIRLHGCKVERNLDLSGALLRARDSVTISLNGGHICGSVYLQQRQWSTNPDGARFCSMGRVQLVNTRIDGEFDCEGGVFIAPRFSRPRIAQISDDTDSDISIVANSLSVGGAVRLCNGFYTKGYMHFVSAAIGSDLLCDGCFLDYPCGDAIELDGATVGGAVYFCLGKKYRYKRNAPTYSTDVPARTNGFLDMQNAQIKQGLYLSGLIFQPLPRRRPADDLERRGNCGVVASFANISGGIVLKIGAPSGKPEGAGTGIEIDLQHATIDVLEDSKESWDRVTAPNLAGLTYQAITSLHRSEMWRCDLLDRQHGPVSGIVEPPGRRFVPFHPQPYLELAKAMQSAGYLSTATGVLIRLEKSHTRFGKLGFWKRLGRKTLFVTAGYGYRPIQAIGLLALLMVATGLIFATAPCGQIIDSMQEKRIAFKSGSAVYCDKSGPDFSPFIYALDTLTPIVDLHQKSRWIVQSPSMEPWIRAFDSTGQGENSTLDRLGSAARESLAPIFALINTYLGWVMATLFVASVAGLLRKGNGGS
jgi:hypothetical protein